MSETHRVVMVATSYPRFPGDTVGTFMAPIARGLADRGHEIHLVLPWHPRWSRPPEEGGVRFHLFRYAPIPSWNVFGYAQALEADVRLRAAAIAATPLALAAGWRLTRAVARRVDATIVQGHWVLPGGAIAAWAASGVPLVVSLHGSDVYVAERHALPGRVARSVFARAAYVTACSEDLRGRAITLGARADRSVTIPYGVDASRFRPDAGARGAQRRAWGLDESHEVLFAVGRFVRKKGFAHLIDAVARLAPSRPRLRLVLAGGGDLDAELRARIAAARLDDRVLLPGLLPHEGVAPALAAADVAVVPSIRDDQGNVDGLPNVVMEALASGTPLVATAAGGIGAVVADGVTGLLVAERDDEALAAAAARLLDDAASRRRLGEAARAWALSEGTWARVAERFEAVFDEAAAAARRAR